ncbi:MAG: hypothetical protein ACRCZF_07765 [Gemmataceae bacterium]
MAAGEATPGRSGRSILFICTGNTCRSPLAEVLCRGMVAQKLGVPVDGLAAAGWTIRSAGLAAFAGDEASLGAQDAAADVGLSLTSHRSRLVNPELLTEATDILLMTSAHAMMLQMRYPGLGPTAQLLCRDHDLPDPYGADPAVYRYCRDMIHQQLEAWMGEWFGP